MQRSQLLQGWADQRQKPEHQRREDEEGRDESAARYSAGEHPAEPAAEEQEQSGRRSDVDQQFVGEDHEFLSAARRNSVLDRSEPDSDEQPRVDRKIDEHAD